MGTFQKKIVFDGAATALVTPFKNGQVDYDAFGRLIDWQIAGGIDALVVCGTTGEGSTLTDEEHRECLRYSVERAAGRVPIVAGTGSNDTDYAIELSKYACEVGCDALLLVTPYYNKATPKGLIKSFLAVADATDKPIILYNVPSRTGVNIPLKVYKELAKHERIVATKEASGNLSAIAEIRAELGDSLAVYSGNDDQIVPIMSLGGRGVISVLSNVMPKETHDMCRFCLDGNYKSAADLQLRLLKLINSLFIEVNPIPAKTACGMMGLCSDEMRLPLCEMEDANRAVLEAAMREVGLIK
ncbi:MAG: 4-hydroxy-tetrahydrodipicolinate synthase [Clostridia bacterium]|nr:4-hydroxy-tetrahydrodipicolinate synthase [Clostridia bacterium]